MRDLEKGLWRFRAEDLDTDQVDQGPDFKGVKKGVMREDQFHTCCIFLALRTFITRCFSAKGSGRRFTWRGEVSPGTPPSKMGAPPPRAHKDRLQDSGARFGLMPVRVIWSELEAASTLTSRLRVVWEDPLRLVVRAWMSKGDSSDRRLSSGGSATSIRPFVFPLLAMLMLESEGKAGSPTGSLGPARLPPLGGVRPRGRRW